MKIVPDSNGASDPTLQFSENLTPNRPENSERQKSYDTNPFRQETHNGSSSRVSNAGRFASSL